MKKLRAGIVGCGGIANAKHLPAMEKCGLYEVVAFCDIIPEQAQETKEKFGSSDAKVFTDYRELVKEDLDVVYVTTPNRSHSEISIAAMEAGKDVMCEKPMARTYAETEKMLETAKRTGRVLNIAYQNRYRPDSTYLKRNVQKPERWETSILQRRMRSEGERCLPGGILMKKSRARSADRYRYSCAGSDTLDDGQL